MGGLRGRPRGRRSAPRSLLTPVVRLARDPHRRGRDAVADARARAHDGRRRRSAARRCSSASSSRWRWRRSSPQFHEMFAGNSEPLGVVLAGGRHVRRRRARRPPRRVAARPRSPGMVLAAASCRCSASRCSTSGSRSPATTYVVLSPDLAPLVTVLWVVVMANAINLIDGLDGLAAGIVAIAGAALFLYADRLFKAGLLEGSNIGPADRGHRRRRLRRLPAVQLQPGADLHGRRRRAVPRPAAGGHDDHGRRAHRRPVQRPDLLLLRPARHPAGHPRRADPRHRVLVRAPAGQAPVVRARPTRTTSTTGSCASATASGGRS